MKDKKVIASYLVRVTLHAPSDPEDTSHVQREINPPPTNDQLSALISSALYNGTNHYADEIGVSSERTDA